MSYRGARIPTKERPPRLAQMVFRFLIFYFWVRAILEIWGRNSNILSIPETSGGGGGGSFPKEM